jgi:ATP-binding protein involved in chromosome partitioning
MSQPDREQVIAALDQVRDPKTGQGLAAAGLARGLIIGEGRAGFMLEVAAEDAALYAPVRDAAEKALKTVAGVDKAQVVLTAAARAKAPTVARRTPGGPPPRAGGGVHVADDPRAGPGVGVPPPAPLPHVNKIIAVASGKGGVGKSTVAVNLACAFAALGLRTGLLDADIYGPSAHKMLGSDVRVRREGETLIPPIAWGVTFMSMGLIAEASRAVPWRGPMATSALKTMIRNVRWGTEDEPLDVLVVDLPPGTGDVHLTFNQNLIMDGAVIVSTPQEIALIDARRAAAMFGLFDNRILGVIENMAYFPDPTTGARIPIFGDGGAKAEAAKLGVPLLAEIPIDIALRIGGDEGRPLTAAEPESPVSQAFLTAARALAA